VSDLVRLSFSIDRRLLNHLETLLREAGYENRSEFIRDLVRHRLVEREWERDEEVVGTLTIIYDHHRRGLTEKLTSLQHQFEGAILANTHVHLDEHLCIEAILVRGRASGIEKLGHVIRQLKGVLKGDLTLASIGKGLR